MSCSWAQYACCMYICGFLITIYVVYNSRLLEFMEVVLISHGHKDGQPFKAGKWHRSIAGMVCPEGPVLPWGISKGWRNGLTGPWGSSARGSAKSHLRRGKPLHWDRPGPHWEAALQVRSRGFLVDTNGTLVSSNWAKAANSTWGWVRQSVSSRAGQVILHSALLRHTCCPQKLWMPHPQKCSMSGWMGLWVYGLVENVPAQGRAAGTTSLRFLPGQSIPWFCDTWSAASCSGIARMREIQT